MRADNIKNQNITSREFYRQIELICEVDREELELQKKEEKDHQTLWKSRKGIQDKRRGAYISIAGTIEAITQEQTQSEDCTLEKQKQALDVIKIKDRELNSRTCS